MGKIAYILEVNLQSMEAHLVASTDKSATIVDSVPSLRKALKRENILTNINEQAIDEAFRLLPTLKVQGGRFLIAKGLAPVHGKDGAILFKVDISGQRVKYQAHAGPDVNEVIDFREAMQITIVKPGDKVAEVTPPTLGEEGMSLAGTTLKAKDGKPAKITPKEGVELSSDGRTFRATLEGRPVFHSGNLTVSPIFEVRGDVDYAVGNIRFNGHVVVHGNVLDDFTIDAKSIEINGVVGASTLIAKGPISINGGINGNTKASIEADGNVEAKYVNQVNMVIRGSLTVAREIINSTIWCRGSVRANKIIGGSCLAMGGVDAILLGSELGVPTLVEPGVNFEIRKVELAIGDLSDKIEKIIRPIKGYLDQPHLYNALPASKKTLFSQSFERFTLYRQEFQGLIAQRARIIDGEGFKPVKEVKVRKCVNPEVTVRTELCRKHFSKRVAGPVTLIEDLEAMTIVPGRLVTGKGLVKDEKEYGRTEETSSPPPKRFNALELEDLENKFRRLITNPDYTYLVIDESVSFRRELIKALRHAGAERVAESDNNVDGLHAARSISGKILVVANMNCRRMDGLTLTRALRKEAKLAGCPIILMSEELRKEKVVEAIRCGANAVLKMPFTPKVLVEKLKAVAAI